MLSNDVQSLNARAPTNRSDSGSDIVPIPNSPSNAPAAIPRTPSGITRSAGAAAPFAIPSTHPSQISSPFETTVSSALHASNTFVPMSTTLSARSIVRSAVQPSKKLSGIAVTPSRKTTSSTYVSSPKT